MASPKRVPVKSGSGLNSLASSMMSSLPQINALPATSSLRLKDGRSSSFAGGKDSGSASQLTLPKETSKSSLAPLPVDDKGFTTRKYQRRKSEGCYLPSKPPKVIPKLKSKVDLGAASSKKRLAGGRRSSRNLLAASGEGLDGGAIGRSVGSLPPITLATLSNSRTPSRGEDAFL
jgi:hypothetical protein